MKNTKSQFIRQYVRASRSPWDDCSTILLLADVVNEQTLDTEDEEINIKEIKLGDNNGYT